MKKERKRLVKKLALWTWSWVATLAIASFGPELIWDHHPFLTIFAILVNLANGLLMLIANRNLFNHFDELEKKLHLESLALTLGLSVIFGLSYSLLNTTHIISVDAEIGLLVGFTGICYLLILLINTRRYR